MYGFNELVERFRSRNSSFNWRDLIRLLNGMGYSEQSARHVEGSWCWFRDVVDGKVIVCPVHDDAESPRNYVLVELLKYFSDRNSI